MSKIIEELVEEEKKELCRQIALGMLLDGRFSLEDVVKFSTLTNEEVQTLAAEHRL